MVGDPDSIGVETNELEVLDAFDVCDGDVRWPVAVDGDAFLVSVDLCNVGDCAVEGGATIPVSVNPTFATSIVAVPLASVWVGVISFANVGR